MNCADTRDRIHSYIDNELDLSKAIEIERHLEQCAACQNVHQKYTVTRVLLRHHAAYFRSPAGLRNRILLSLEAGNELPARTSMAQHGNWLPQRTPMTRRGNWLPALPWPGAAFALSVVLALAVVFQLPRIHVDDRLPEEIVSSHVRSIMSGHLADVSSPDQRAIKPWFDRKLTFSPPIADLDAQGFTLVGGRLDYIRHRPVAALVYRHAGHIINVFSWPASRTEAPVQTLSREGFHLVNWNHSGIFFCVVSDLPSATLAEFARILRTSPG